MNRENIRGIGMIVLALFLMLFGITMLISIAVPGWFVGALAFIAGLLLIAGR